MEIYQNIFQVSTFPCFLLEPREGQFLIRDVNVAYVDAQAKKYQKLTGMSIPEVFQENPEHLGTSWETIHNSLNKAFLSGQPDTIEILRYDLMNYEIAEFEETYWQIENIPIKNATCGTVTLILFIARDKTLEVLKKMKNAFPSKEQEV